ncbi:MAG: protein translocase subunit SecD [Immundisolibacteraceae bacterium]|nr:protein translocase subunit SecD [Immundisolibacteraceae bacterium]
MNRYPLWKNLLVLLTLIGGGLYALPNIFGSDPALQISARRDAAVDQVLVDQIAERLKKDEISYRQIELKQDQVLVRFDQVDTQLSAQPLIREELGRDYGVALNLVPATPDWLANLDAMPMFLGLDLRGGVHFLLEVDMPVVLRQAEERLVADFKPMLRDAKLRYTTVKRFARDGVTGVELRFRDAESRQQSEELISGDYEGLLIESVDRGGDYWLEVVIGEQLIRENETQALKQNILTLRNRVNELGVAEPMIQQQGRNRVIVQLPGVQDTVRARELLGATATLQFKAVDEGNSLEAALAGRVPAGSALYPHRDGSRILLKKRTVLTGEYITNASSGLDSQSGEPLVNVSLDGRGAKIMSSFTGKNIGKRMAVIFIENKKYTVTDDEGESRFVEERVEEVITAPVIRDQLSARFQISGSMNSREARDLALLLRAGSLAAPMHFVEERTVGPSLGLDNVNQGVRSVVVGLLLVVAFMVAWYRGFGLVANTALALNLMLLVAVLSLLQATLTLPGIAGVVLTVGMAVDANVLIFERIREELGNGNSPQAGIHAGFDKAFSTIFDANVTTLIAAAVLFIFGTGPVKGFAVTLSVGIVTSMFTAILVTRALVNLVWGGRSLKSLPIGKSLVAFKGDRAIKFMSRRKIGGIISALLILVSIGSLATRGLQFGIDFTGGTLVEVAYDQAADLDQIEATLDEAGLEDAVVQLFGAPNDVLIRLAAGQGGDLAQLSGDVLTALQRQSPDVELRRVEFVGPQVGEELTQDGGLALLFALVGILVYVGLRFRYQFALGAVAALVHDVIITMGIFSLFAIEFDLTVLAALLAVIGYSLNDTIVVFDRIRENFTVVRRGGVTDVIDRSLNDSLSRTVVTSVTTLLVLLALLFLGGEVIHGFALALTIGVLIGTYSSLLVASPVLVMMGLTRQDMEEPEKEGALAEGQ